MTMVTDEGNTHALSDNHKRNDKDATNDSLDANSIIVDSPRPATLISLGSFDDADYLTKKELCEVFKCGHRTIQRMVERFEIPPPIWLAGRKVWIVGALRSWIAAAAKRNNEEAARVARKMRIFD